MAGLRASSISSRMAHREQLVTAIAEDGLELDGVIIQPSNDEQQLLVVWIHGFGANFYFAPYLRLARALAACGIATAVVNTRGHDLATLLQPQTRAPYWGGSAWENLDESPRDLAGWVDAAVSAGFSGVVLVGHSLGAVKVTHYLAERQDPRVLGLALASPALQPAWDTRAHPAALAEAERSVSSGHPEALFDGPWGHVSAQTYLSLDRIGFDQFGRTTSEPSLARIGCPIFAIIGAEDVQVCTVGDLDVIQRNATAASRVEMHVIDGSDHFFTGHVAVVANLLANWVTTLS